MGSGVSVQHNLMNKSWKKTMSQLNSSIKYRPPNSENNGSSNKNGFNTLCARVLLCNHSSSPLYFMQSGNSSGSFVTELTTSSFTGPEHCLPPEYSCGFIHSSNRSILPMTSFDKRSSGYIKLMIKADDGMIYVILFGFCVEANGNNRMGIRIIQLIRNLSRAEKSLSPGSSRFQHKNKISPLVSAAASADRELTNQEMEELLNTYHTKPSMLEMQRVTTECPLLEIEAFFNNEEAGLFIVNFNDFVKIIRG